MKKTSEKIGEIIFLLSAVMSVFLILLIIFFIFSEGMKFVNEYGLLKFITGTVWKPTAGEPKFGIFPMIVGSIIVTILSTIIALPFGLSISVFMAYYAKKSYGPLKSLINLMAAIPSVVYGFFAMMVLVPLIKDLFDVKSGMNMVTASILLAIMILPTMVNISENSLRQVPKTFISGSLALGATKEETITKVLIPYAKSGIFSSIILAVGRAIGETMAVYLEIGRASCRERV